MARLRSRPRRGGGAELNPTTNSGPAPRPAEESGGGAADGSRPEPAGNRDKRDRQTPAGKPTGTAKEKPKQSLPSFILELVLIVTVGLVITTLLRAFVFQPFEVPSGSMENTLQVNDKIVALRVIDFKRGDIVVFQDANGWLGAAHQPSPARRVLEFVGVLPSSAEGHLVKRVVGLPGDRVSCCDELGRISVNGVPLEESAYLYSDAGGQVQPAEKPFEVVVPDGHLFVLGDHRNASGDSRCHLQDIPPTGGPAGSSAFIPVDAVVGTVTVIMAPLNRIQTLETPAAFSGVPPPAEPAPREAEIVRVSEGC